jgi:hypothetical protein
MAIYDVNRSKRRLGVYMEGIGASGENVNQKMTVKGRVELRIGTDDQSVYLWLLSRQETQTKAQSSSLYLVTWYIALKTYQTQ